jgi:hypothetical protein
MLVLKMSNSVKIHGMNTDKIPFFYSTDVIIIITYTKPITRLNHYMNTKLT